MPQTIETIHKSVVIPVTLDRKVAVRLARERRTFNAVMRELIEQYVGAK